MSFYEFLQYAGGPGIGVVIGFVLSFLIENWPWYANLGERAKRLFFYGLCFVLPIVCTVLIGVLGYEPWSLEMFWAALVAAFAAASSGTLAHTRKLSAS